MRTKPLVLTLSLVGAAALLSILLGGKRAAADPGATSTTITLPAAADTTVDRLRPYVNLSTADELELYYSEIQGAAYAAYVLLRFEVAEVIPADAIIDSAILQLYQIGGGGQEQAMVTIHPILEDWSSTGVNWNNQPDVYTGPFLTYATLDNETGWKEIGLTFLVDDWLAGPNYGVELRGPLAVFQRVFESTHHNERVPQLVVTYHLPPANTATPTATPSNTPSPTATPTSTATPTRTPTPAAPDPPGAVNASDGSFGDRVRITWSGVNGATRYEIYRGATAAGGALLGSCSGTSFDDTTATAGVTYYYWVKACNEAGCSAFSASDTGYRGAEPPAEGPLPDLIVTDLWPDGEAVCLQILNAGEGGADGPFELGLWLDEAEWSSLRGPRGLEPGERWSGCFAGAYTCTPLLDSLLAEVDAAEAVVEAREDNNRRAEEWLCDGQAPRISEGPSVEDVGTGSAAIVWLTDEDADSRVRYGQIAGAYGAERGSDEQVTRHRVVLTGLEADTAYHFQAGSTDASGHNVTSGDLVFATLPLPDTQRPSVRLFDPGPGRGTVLVQAEATDKRQVERVEFWLDGERRVTDYSAPYVMEVDTLALANGEHELGARAFDVAGNSAQDGRLWLVNNPRDARAPRVTIMEPARNAAVSGEVLVRVSLEDDQQLEEALLYVDGLSVDRAKVRGRDNEHFFAWDSRSFENGARQLLVEAVDESGKRGTAAVDITVHNPTPARPLFTVTTHSATRFGSRLAVLLVVKNIGTAAARDLDISDWMTAFIPQSQSSSQADYDTYWRVPAFSSEIAVKGDIPAGEHRYLAFTVIPTLDYPVQPAAMIGDPLEFNYKDTSGQSYTQTFKAPITKATDGQPLAQARVQALKGADYLVVSNPQRLLQNFWLQSFDVLDAMGRLAVARNGAVGLVQSSSAYVVDALITPPANNPYVTYVASPNWASQLHPDFSKELGGYVLLVGEVEIVPSWQGSGFQNGAVAPESDYPYSDSGGDGRPELMVGRAIGDKAQTLIGTMEAAIGVVDGEPGHAFEFDRALLVSGPPAGSFVSDVNGAAAILAPKLSTVLKLHADAYMQAAAFLPRTTTNTTIPHAASDGLAAGDVLGGTLDEVILAKGTTHMVHVFNREGGTRSQFAAPGFDGLGTDYLAVGDVRGGGKAEIVIGDADADQIVIYDGNGGSLLRAFNFPVYAALAVGDVSGDAREEVLIADADLDRIWIGSGDPLSFAFFARKFDPNDRLLAADLLGDGKEEIVVLDWSANTLYVLNNGGTQLATLAFGQVDVNGQKTNWLDYVGTGSRLAAANLWPGTKEELVLAPAQHYAERVFTYFYDTAKSQIRSRGELGFTYDGSYSLAAGNVYVETGETTWQREEVLVATNDNLVRILDTENYTQRLQTDLAAGALGTDIILWSGHGNVNVWGGVINSHSGLGLPMNFGGHHPVIVGVSCLTGNYQRPSNEHKHIAEVMLASGAGVYIGATETSWGYTNREAVNWLFKNWQKGQSIGEAFTKLERATWNNDPLGTAGVTESWRYWTWQYNLYGDPQFGAPLSSTTVAGEALGTPAGPEPAAAADPPTLLEVAVPAYTVERAAFGDALDEVRIPGGDVWLQPGELRVPYLTQTVSLPPYLDVAEVLLLERAGLREETGVSIPVNERNAAPCACTPLPAPGTGDGWFPELPYRWQVHEDGSGARSLLIHIFPLQYNAQTTALAFWDTFRLEIVYRATHTGVKGVLLSRWPVDPGQPLAAEVHLSREGEPAELFVAGELYGAATGELVRGMPVQRLRALSGSGSLLLPLETAGLPPGDYQLRLWIKDAAGQLQDTHTLGVHLGNPDAAITELSAVPRPVLPGQPARLGAALRNTGSTVLAGTLSLAVRGADGSLIAEYLHPFSDLAPGALYRAEDVLPGAQVGSGSYRLLATAAFEGQTRQGVLPLSEITAAMNYLPVVGSG